MGTAVLLYLPPPDPGNHQNSPAAPAWGAASVPLPAERCGNVTIYTLIYIYSAPDTARGISKAPESAEINVIAEPGWYTPFPHVEIQFVELYI